MRSSGEIMYSTYTYRTRDIYTISTIYQRICLHGGYTTQVPHHQEDLQVDSCSAPLLSGGTPHLGIFTPPQGASMGIMLFCKGNIPPQPNPEYGISPPKQHLSGPILEQILIRSSTSPHHMVTCTLSLMHHQHIQHLISTGTSAGTGMGLRHGHHLGPFWGFGAIGSISQHIFCIRARVSQNILARKYPILGQIQGLIWDQEWRGWVTRRITAYYRTAQINPIRMLTSRHQILGWILGSDRVVFPYSRFS